MNATPRGGTGIYYFRKYLVDVIYRDELVHYAKAVFATYTHRLRATHGEAVT